MPQKHCPECGKFLDAHGACTISCAHGWHATSDGFKIHPEDAVVDHVRYDPHDGRKIVYYEMKRRVDRKHPVALW